jgi:hypothetical protein
MWPLLFMFGLTPLWWAMGALYLFWPLLSVVLIVVLLQRGRVVLPMGAGLWLLMIGLILASATRVDKVSGLFMYGLRLGFVVAALIVYLYVYNAARTGTQWRRLFQPLCLFWLAMIALGWIGVFAPRFALTTPVEVLLPGSISQERVVQAMTHVQATEFNAASRNPYFRTAAPYPYTNNWGMGYAILVPCVLAYLSSVRTGILRVALIVSLPLSLIPAFLTLNRGMFIGLGAGLLYLGLRALLRGDVRLIASIAGVAVLMGLATLFVPVTDLIMNRVENTDSTKDRADLYWQTIDAVWHSPLLGYGGPRMVDTTSASEPLGTQGQLWLMMYSYGLPALLIMLTVFAVIAWRLSAAVSAAGTWLSTIPVIVLVVTPFYGYTDMNLSIVFFGIALGVAAIDGPINRATTTTARPPLAQAPSLAAPGPAGSA